MSNLTVIANGANELGYGVYGTAEGETGRGAYAQNGFINITTTAGSISLAGKGGDSRGIEVAGLSQDSSSILNSSNSIYLSSQSDGSKENGTSIGLFIYDYGSNATANLEATETISITSSAKTNSAYGIQTQNIGALSQLSATDVLISASVEHNPSNAQALRAAAGHIDIRAIADLRAS